MWVHCCPFGALWLYFTLLSLSCLLQILTFKKKKQLLCAQTSAHAEFCCGDLGSRTISYDAIALCHMCACVCFLRLVGVRVCEPLSCQAWQHLLSSPALQDDLIAFTLSPLTAFDRHFARLKLGVKSQSRVKRHVTVSEEWKAPIVN